MLLRWKIGGSGVEDVSRGEMAERQCLVLQQWSPESLGPIILWEPWKFVQNLIFWQLTCQFCYVLSSSLLHQVVLMVGLPASGKSVWARNYMKQHPEKQHRLLGTEELLACMIVSQISALHSCDSHSEVMGHTWCKMFDPCVCVCIEWWAEGQQAPAGLSLSYWNNQDGCPNSWKLHPRPGNASRSKEKTKQTYEMSPCETHLRIVVAIRW